MAELDVDVVSQDRAVWSGSAKAIRGRTIEGDIGILPGHTPVLALLAQGELMIEPTSGTPLTANIDGGFFSVDSDRVTIVADDVEVTSS